MAGLISWALVVMMILTLSRLPQGQTPKPETHERVVYVTSPSEDAKATRTCDCTYSSQGCRNGNGRGHEAQAQELASHWYLGPTLTLARTRRPQRAWARGVPPPFSAGRCQPVIPACRLVNQERKPKRTNERSQIAEMR